MKDEMREAFDKWLISTKQEFSGSLNPLDIWQAACKYQINKDAEICDGMTTEYEFDLPPPAACADAIRNQQRDK